MHRGIDWPENLKFLNNSNNSNSNNNNNNNNSNKNNNNNKYNSCLKGSKQVSVSALITKLLESSKQLRVFQKTSYIRGAYMLL